jgi:hypothetical protein
MDTGVVVDIRTFQRGDESAQVAIYNEAAAALPKFKPATTQEVLRRVTARDFDAGLRFYAVEGGEVVGYVAANPNGRVSYPWCRKGREACAEPLFRHVLEALGKRGLAKLFAAYRADWPAVQDFFRGHGFVQAREMVNFYLDLQDMPTAPARRASNVTPLERADVAALFALAPLVVRCGSPKELEKYLFDNPYFPASSLFALRGKAGEPPLAAGLLVANTTYAEPRTLDAAMPCFRLGAFGTEGMTTKRVRGLFSFLARDDSRCGQHAVELLTHAAQHVEDSDEISALGAQVPSDAGYWLRFYQSVFRKQGSFPVLERNLA